MTIEKARKKLELAKEHLQDDRQNYVHILRSTNRAMDIRFSHLGGKTPREKMISDVLEEIKEDKERIARYERIAL